MQMESPEEACGGTNADREMVPTVSGMEARGVQRRVQQRSTVGRGSGRNAKDESVHASPGAAFQRAELTQDPLRSGRESAPRANAWDSQGATHTTGKRSAPANYEERQQQPPTACWHARRVGRLRRPRLVPSSQPWFIEFAVGRSKVKVEPW